MKPKKFFSISRVKKAAIVAAIIMTFLGAAELHLVGLSVVAAGLFVSAALLNGQEQHEKAQSKES